MSSYFSAAISGITKTASYYYNRAATSEAQAKELSDKVAGYFEKEVKALLEKGVDPSAATRDGKPLLSYTVMNQNDVFIKPLVQYGAEVDHVDETGKTALHHAIIRGTHNAVSQLLQLGANPDVQDENGMTPLHFAARDEKAEKVATLIHFGADHKIQTKLGHIASDLVRSGDEKTKTALDPTFVPSATDDEREQRGSDALLKGTSQ